MALAATSCANQVRKDFGESTFLLGLHHPHELVTPLCCRLDLDASEIKEAVKAETAPEFEAPQETNTATKVTVVSETNNDPPHDVVLKVEEETTVDISAAKDTSSSDDVAVKWPSRRFSSSNADEQCFSTSP